MIEPKIYIARAKKSQNNSGFDVEKGIEVQKYFRGAYYKKATGLGNYGKSRMYQESFPEELHPDIFFPNEITRETTDFTLTLYFFDIDNHDKEEDAIKAIDDSYHSFVNYITGSYLKYWDNVRNRKVMLSFSGEVKLANDTLYGIIYKEADFKFTNIYGKSFPLNANTLW